MVWVQRLIGGNQHNRPEEIPTLLKLHGQVATNKSFGDKQAAQTGGHVTSFKAYLRGRLRRTWPREACAVPGGNISKSGLVTSRVKSAVIGRFLSFHYLKKLSSLQPRCWPEGHV